MRLLVTRDDYFRVAMEMLATEGAGKLKIATLCKRLKVTTGSFYGYFGSWDGFVEQFLEHWDEEQTARIERLVSASEDPLERVLVMKKLAGTVPHEAEAAIRGWAHTNAAVDAAQKRVDEHRVQALSDVLGSVVPNRDEAHRLAVMGITLLVGLQQWRSPVTQADFDLVFDSYEQMVLARVALG